ncbi:ORF6C domain-containing protein [Lysinibacillus macroides]|uniref:ORF6C domain-containing protein n=1 Tax=Lysinibacillus macroides TaxID=33935 RepID=UPI0006B4BF5A|nr:ORF6C domain-containing protein [Lysinibacillus macroides]QPR68564.1 ORF6C domain-containing protein [Lysinibacillus macroides]
MNQLQVITYRNNRVLRTAQIAESYGTDSKSISKNFTNNKERYVAEKHYFCLKGEELRTFRKIYELPSNISALYLWTEKGAWLHAKSLNTDKAWDAYEMLVDEYYKIIEPQPILTVEQQRREHLKLSIETSERVDKIESKLDKVVSQMRIDGVEQQNIQQQGTYRVIQALGGKESPAYEKISRKVFSALWSEFKRYFCIPRYSELPKINYEEALKFISMWQPSTSMQLEIEQYNRQAQLKLVK